jgi:hypothetical protein
MVMMFAGIPQGTNLMNGFTILALKKGVIRELSITWYLYSGIILRNHLDFNSCKSKI